MPTIPAVILRQLYVKGSLKSSGGATIFALQNNLATATIQGMGLAVDGKEISPFMITVETPQGNLPASSVSPGNPFSFSTGTRVQLAISGLELAPGSHELTIRPLTKEVGEISFTVNDDCQ